MKLQGVITKYDILDDDTIKVTFAHVVDGKYVKHTAIADENLYVSKLMHKVLDIEVDETTVPWKLISPAAFSDTDREAMKLLGL